MLTFLIVPLLLLLVASAGFFLVGRKLSERTLHLSIAVGAGVMIAVALLHVFPEAVEVVPEFAAVAFIGGFLVMYLIENLTGSHPCAEIETHCHYHALSVSASIALIVHTLFDGVSIAAAAYLGETIGLVVLLWVAVHQVPVSLSLASLLGASKFSRIRKQSILALFALAAPLGYVITACLLSALPLISEAFIALLVAFSGGTLLYVGASDLLPSVHRHTRDRVWTVVAVMFGFTLAFVAGLLE